MTVSVNDIEVTNMIASKEKDVYALFTKKWKTSDDNVTKQHNLHLNFQNAFKLTNISPLTLTIFENLSLHKSLAHFSTTQTSKIIVAVEFFNKTSDQKELLKYCIPMALNHSSVQKVYGITEIAGKVGVVMEHFDICLEKEKLNLSLIDKFKILRHIASTLDYCHTFGIAHGNLRPSNIYLRKVEDEFIPVISNFGFMEDANGSFIVSPINIGGYVAPEIFLSTDDNIDRAAADVWAFIVMMIHIFSGVGPFDGICDDRISSELRQHRFPYSDRMISSIHGHEIAKLCLNFDPSKRPSFAFITDYLQMIIGIVTDLPYVKYKMDRVFVPSDFDVSGFEQNGRPKHIFYAAAYGNFELVKQCIKAGIDVNKQGLEGRTSLFAAVFNGNSEIVEFLLDFGADVNLPTLSGTTPLLLSCERGHFDVFLLLLKNGADIFCCDNNGASPLFISCQNGHANIAKILLDHKVDINLCMNGFSPLYVSCQESHLDVAKLLLKRGADINLCDNNGASPLYFCCQECLFDIAKLLLDCGADINLRTNEGLTPLYYSCQEGHFDMAEMLLCYGADVNLINVYGASPLYISCQEGHYDLVKLLLAHDVDFNCKVQGIYRPIDIATNLGHFSIVSLLQPHYN
eukprot:TRINITY_DN3148_c0_g2_i1.p1 TRINITY_DN3148_c0_g2~~TRINITY_DN3148_c0_g2_i1.p1  ORF type:complete len:629 (+),score=137.73 TRINITY_DN3148_c0_g2_i1:940-2826(+)